MRIVMVMLLGAALFGCVKKMNTPAAEIPQLKTLADVMDTQSTVIDPQFKKIGQASYSDADWAAFTDAATRLQATSTHIKDFAPTVKKAANDQAGFTALADTINAKAKALGDAAQAKNAAAASTALAEMKETCRTCHKKYR